ncbi:MAG TPA: ATP-binding protein [Baekduia sp.]|nr:ATP-binding protein [Baekduia sp.]
MSISSRIEYVRAEDLLDEPVPTDRAPHRGIGRRRQLTGVALAAVVLPLLTLLLDRVDRTLSVEGEVLLYLLVVVGIAVVGGMIVGVVSAVAAALLINYFFVAPKHTFDVAHGDQAVALGVFVVVAAVVSGTVELAARRARAAELAAAQAETLSGLAGSDLNEGETLGDVLSRARTTFNMETVTLRARERPSGEWVDVQQAGWAPPGQEAPLRFDVPIGTDLRLVGRGPALFAEDRRVLEAFAAAAQTAFEGRKLSEQAREAQSLAIVDRQRTALLAAVGHDLRTPLSGVKAAVTSLRQTDVSWSPEERDALLATIEDSADRLDGVVANLLDASRLQAGVVTVHAEAVALDQVVGSALLAVPQAQGCLQVDVPDNMPLIHADPGLLERVLANIIDNAVRHGGDQPITLRATAGSATAKVEVIDHGPGVAPEHRERLFEPFQRLDDRSTVSGVGLGLWVAHGFMTAMDGALVADTSPGGGLTMRLRVPLAETAAT